MYLRDLAIFADENLVDRFKGGFVGRFPRECSCIVDHYLNLIQRKIRSGDIAKVAFEMTDNRDCPPNSNEIETMLNVLRMPWPFEFDRYIESDAQSKKRMVLEALHTALIWTADVYHWDKSPLENARTVIFERDFRFVGFSRKSWVSPSTKYRVRVHFEYELDEVRLTAFLYRNRSKTEITRKFLGTGIPLAGCLHSYLAKGEWTSETTFVLTKTDYWGKELTADFSDVVQADSTAH